MGTKPSRIAVGDLDGDTKPDIAVTNSSNSFSVRLGAGDGTFGPRVDYPTSGTPNGIAIADLNADGRRDVVVSIRGTNTLVVYLGDGAASMEHRAGFAPGVAYPGGFGFLAIADLNGDTKPDLAVIHSASVSILLGNGDGTFGAKIDYGTGIGASAFAIGDVNSDGRPDLVVTNQAANTASILVNTGGAPWVSVPDLEPAGASWARIRPTPARDEITVEFALAQPAEVAARVFDLNGRAVATLARAAMPAGSHAVRWDRRVREGGRAAAGVYFVEVRAGAACVMKRAVLIQ
jgi:hypothetical protein